MLNESAFPIIDKTIFTIANLVNLLLVALFLSRMKQLDKLEFTIGIIVVGMALPLSAIVIMNIIAKREWWTIVLPLILILYCLIELLFDYILKIDFRNTNLLWPYITVYYLALMGMIGYSFLIGKPYGFITLSTYFMNLMATWLAHSSGHG